MPHMQQVTPDSTPEEVEDIHRDMADLLAEILGRAEDIEAHYQELSSGNVRCVREQKRGRVITVCMCARLLSPSLSPPHPPPSLPHALTHSLTHFRSLPLSPSSIS